MSLRFKPIIPQAFNVLGFRTAIKVRMKGTGAKIKKDFEKTTKTWNTKVHFSVQTAGVFNTTIKVTTSNQVYAWVNDGTKPYSISGPAKVSVGFQPKTSYRYIGSRAGNPGTTAFARNINHPGIEAREFDIAIADKWKDELGEEFELALKAGSIASGHWWR